MNVLSIYAHPDDETMLAGGSLALLARAGAQVHYVSATRGEGGENGEPPLCSLDELGAVRAEEMSCAAQALGGASLHFLDYIDPRVGADNVLYAYSTDQDRLVIQVLDLVRRLEIDAVFTHGTNGEYGHPAHVFTHQAVVRALQSLGAYAPLLYAGQAAYPDHPRPRLMNRDDPADLLVDVSAVLAQKTAAALCHRTQHALFVRHRSAEVGRQLSVPEVIMPVESLHRILPAVEGELDDPLAQMLLGSGHATRLAQ